MMAICKGRWKRRLEPEGQAFAILFLYSMALSIYDIFFFFFFFFLLNIFTQDIPLGWKPLQMWGPAQHTLLHKQ